LSVNPAGDVLLKEVYWVKTLAVPIKDTQGADSFKLLNGVPQADSQPLQAGHIEKIVFRGKKVERLPNVGPLELIEGVRDSTIVPFFE